MALWLPAPQLRGPATLESSVYTSTSSSGGPGSSGVKHKVEQSESNHGSLKARGCSSSITDTHSHDHCCGSISGSVLPCPCILSLGGTLGFDCPLTSISSCSSSSGSSPSGSASSSCIYLPSFSKEELPVQARRQWVPSSMMQSASWGAHGTKFTNATTILSSAQLRLLVTPWAGTHSASSLAGLYARTLPS